ncbi:MAG: isoprenylcysteine carboxylmethyltransferase family protein [Syntrophobacteraceae bacterium]|jgi:protein-S-isoprenylcysteine O-methyltransferase Ste14|nr:isoprenylcysteine carboxylmethyltransferase family protein [Syntrophobacteraceae bacterium]
MNLSQRFKTQRIKTTNILVGIVAIPLLFSSSGWEGTGILSTVLFLLGTVLVGVATVGRIWCSIYISGYKNNQLITFGPYSISRNPLYFFSLVGTVGLGLETETLIIPIVAALGFMMLYPAVMAQEEQKLLQIHGEAFETYCRSTPRFWPSFSRLQEPETYELRPRVFRRRLFDSLWFVWGIGILELIEGLRESDMLVTLFKLY